MARFAGSARGRSYEFEQNRLFGPTETKTDFTGASASLGGLPPGLYDLQAKTGWDPQGALSSSVVNRANEKMTAVNSHAEVMMARDSRDAAIEANEIAAKKSREATDKQTTGSMIGAGIQTAVTLGAALLSDERTKDHIRPLNYALEKLRELKPVTFHYNEEYSSSPERLHHGFIAQDFQQVLPDATYFDESTERLCIDTGDLIGILVRAIQELEGRVSRMEATQYLAGVR